MNAARRRRPGIRHRARLAMLRRLRSQRAQPEPQVIRIKPETRRAAVFLKTPNNLQDFHAMTFVNVDLPVERATQMIHDMQEYGFWSPHVENENNCMRYIPPQSIAQVLMWTEAK